MIIETLQAHLYDSQKKQDTLRIGVLRYLLAQMKNKEIELRPQQKEFNDEVALAVLKKQIKQRKEAVENYSNAGRSDLADKETAELGILSEYLQMFEPQV